MKLPPALSTPAAPFLPVDARPPSSSLAPAAVLVLLYPCGSDVHFLLTQRPSSLNRHAGQIALPGGAAESHDASLWQTALRETQEELGVRTGRIRPLGQLEAVPILASGYLIVPFVAWSPCRPVIRPDPAEVAAVFEPSLRALLDPGNICEETWELRGQLWQVVLYRLEGATVWGATARILSDLDRRVSGEARRDDLRPGSVCLLNERPS